ncbi:MAG: cobalamin biosynthesis protein [Frankia sp.]
MPGSPRAGTLALGLAAGCALDALLGDPARFHPVAGFGRTAGAVERRLYVDHRLAGVAYTAVCVGVPVAVAQLVAGPGLTGSALAGSAPIASSRRPGLAVAAVAGASWAVLGGASLRRHGRRLGRELGRGDLEAARCRLPALCGRDPAALDTPDLARAGVESLAENTSDAVVGPLVWGAVAGLPGLLGYRAVNTLDAMVGHRGERYGRFGWASARLDDGANLLPARLAGALTCACAPLVGGSPRAAWRMMRRDGRHHPSPNAGHVEAAFAGALGLRLGGPARYPHGVEHRPTLGSGRPARAADLDRAATLSGAVSVGALVVAAGGRLLAGWITTEVAGWTANRTGAPSWARLRARKASRARPRAGRRAAHKDGL